MNVDRRQRTAGRVSPAVLLALALVVVLGVIVVPNLLESNAADEPDGETVRRVPGQAVSLELVRLLNDAKGYLENGDGGAALGPLERALALAPRQPVVLRNMARAKLLQKDAPAALEQLAAAREVEPDAPATRYLSAVANARLDRWDEALVDLEPVVRHDPSVPAARFQLGQAYAGVGRDDEAVEQWLATTELDPSHAAAWFRLAKWFREQGQTAEFRRANLEFVRLRGIYGETHVSNVALEACRYTAAEAAPGTAPAGDNAPPDSSLVVAFVERESELPGARAVSVLALGDDGRYTLVALDPDGRLTLIEPAADGGLTFRTVSEPDAVPDGEWRLVVGNVHDPAVPDNTPRRQADVLAVGKSGVYLWQRTASGGLEDVTGVAGFSGLVGTDAAFVDIDHDGDLDLALVGGDGLQLLQNLGGGAFDDLPADSGLPDTGAALAVACGDLDGNAALDLVVARGSASTLLVDNRRAGRLAAASGPAGSLPACRAVLLDDLDNDLHIDAVLLSEGDVVLRFGGPGGLGSGPRLALDGLLAHDMALVDPDNDGWLDLVVVGERNGLAAVRIWRNAGRDAWLDATATWGLDQLAEGGPVRDVLVADLDGDGDSDLLLRDADDRLRLLENQGGAANGQLKLRLVSLMNTGGAIGTRVEVRRDETLLARSISVDAPIEIGVGSLSMLDSVLSVWPDGVVETRLAVDPLAGPLTVAIVRKVDTGSCPFLYTWDGDGYRFVNDLVGASPVGVPLARGVPLPSQPSETLVLGPDVLVPDGDHYRLRMSCELREVFYLDHTRLRAVDHDRAVEIATTHMLSLPPFPSGELLTLSDLRPPRQARRENGLDVTAELAALDGRHAAPGEVLPAPYRGTCRPWSLTLEFDELPHDEPLVLALSGWLQWTTSSANIALSQDPAVDAAWPTLEVRDAQGHWQPLDVVTGLPAGKGKTVVYELTGALPAGAQALRLATSFEVSWDRIVLARPGPVAESAVTELAFSSADLQWMGFCELAPAGPGLPPTPDPARVSAWPPWLTATEGWCTAYGDVIDLLAAVDGRLVVINAGDAVTLRAPVSGVPPVPAGRIRSWVIDTAGSAKENDVNCVEGRTVEPLPGADPHADWQLRFNTRWVPADRFAR